MATREAGPDTDSSDFVSPTGMDEGAKIDHPSSLDGMIHLPGGTFQMGTAALQGFPTDGERSCAHGARRPLLY